MSGDGKFFLGVAVAAVLAIVAFFVFSSGSSGEVVDVDEAIGHKLGSDDAKVKIVEFGDFQCPACRAAAEPLKTAYENNKENVQLIYRHIPLSIHPNADEAALASEAAAFQGKFWEMYDILYAQQDSWANLQDPKNQFEVYAQALGLDLDKYKSDYSSSAAKDNVKRDEEASVAAGVNSTPTFFVNGEKITGALNIDQWQEIIDEKLANAKNE